MKVLKGSTCMFLRYLTSYMVDVISTFDELSLTFLTRFFLLSFISSCAVTHLYVYNIFRHSNFYWFCNAAPQNFPMPHIPV